MTWSNFHGHCHYCDGKYAPEEHVKSAIAQGMPVLGISSHSPVPFATSWNMKVDRLPDYLEELRDLRERYRDQIQLCIGMEVDFIPETVSVSSPWIKEAELDYTVGSIHFVDAFADGTPWEVDGPHECYLKGMKEIFGASSHQAIERYYALTREMVQTQCPDVVGHMDKIKMQSEGETLFSETEAWYQQAVLQTLEEIRDAGAIVEVNTRGNYKKRDGGTYPSPWILEQIYAMGIPICLNSDAHLPEELTRDFVETAVLLQQMGFRELMSCGRGTGSRFHLMLTDSNYECFSKAAAKCPSGGFYPFCHPYCLLCLCLYVLLSQAFYGWDFYRPGRLLGFEVQRDPGHYPGFGLHVVQVHRYQGDL